MKTDKILAIMLICSIGLWLALDNSGVPHCRDTGFNPVEYTALSNMLLRENNAMKENK
jgi:hypothetical protein